MSKLNRQINSEDVEYKGLPFACENCGNKPTMESLNHDGVSCSICGDVITTYTLDAFEYIASLKQRITELEEERERAEIVNSALNSLVIDLQASLRAINTVAILEHAAEIRRMIKDLPALTTTLEGDNK